MEAVMNNAVRLFGIITLTVLLVVSCRQLFTESVGSSLARDDTGISSSSSLDDLVDIAKTRNSSNPDVAKDLLAALAKKNPADIAKLSNSEKESILNLAGSASLDLKTITTLSQKIKDNKDNQNQLIQDAINAASSDVDTTVIEQILSDDDILASAAPETIVIASTSIIASLSADVGAETVTDILANPESLESSSLTQAQKDQLSIVIHAADVLETRPDAADTTIGGFNLLDLLRGNT